MAQTLEMAILYIKSVDDENFLTAIIKEEDYYGRDSLRIAQELELLDLIMTPKVEAIIKRIYYSDYQISGNLLETSSTYQIIFGKQEQGQDLEPSLRFYKKRDLTTLQQTQWGYHIFKVSINTRLTAQSLVSLVYVCIQAVFFQIFMQRYESHRQTLISIRQIR